MRALACAVAAVVLTLRGTAGNMIDVLFPEMAPPVECASGCLDWTDAPASVWKSGTVPATASNHCAQPGAAVNEHTSGAWCYCKTSGPPPVPHPAAFYGTITDVDGFVTNGPLGLNTFPNGTAELIWRWDHDSSGDKCVLVDLLGNFTQRSDGTVEIRSPSSYYWFNGTASKDPAGERIYSGKMYNPSNEVCGSWSVLAGAPAKLPDCLEGTSGYCTQPNGVPGQINIQLDTPNSVVVSWVTMEAVAPADPPTLSLTPPSGSPVTVKGVTHEHTSPGEGRKLYLHFVRVSGLKDRATYQYKVASGGAGAVFSSTFSFRAPYASGETKIDIYGDLGIYEWNAIEWLQQDCANGTVDAIVHMGDHAYNEGDDSGRRADGYMQGFQPVLSNCPWMPIVGNHEYYSGEELGRYLDSTWEKWEGTIPDTNATTDLSSLGMLLSVGSHHGPGLHSSTPSNTSRYFSVDQGLVHLVALDFNTYYGDDPLNCAADQLAWLHADLKAAAANREVVPWIALMAHFPVFCTGCAGNGELSAEYYASKDAEVFGNGNVTAALEYDQRTGLRSGAAGKGKGPLKGASDNLVSDIAPVLQQYGVDLFLAGHWHYYESLFPGVRGTATCPACLQPTQRDFESPKGTVHITTGNGGPPGKDSFTEHCPGEDCNNITATRRQSTEYGFGRLVFHNATHVTFSQFLNADGSLFDTFTIHSPTHGPFTDE